MKVSGFSYIRNGFNYDYPFIESIKSILPICDEFIITVGESIDGTKEAIEALDSPKIKIIDTVWDDKLRIGGKIFSQQTNIALDNITGDWAFHIQADEVIHENDLKKIYDTMLKYQHNERVEGFLFDFLNFYGGYKYIGTTRRWHRNEIRIVRNLPNIRSYRDSQGFRIYPSREHWENSHQGKSLKVIKLDVPIYHYSYARHPALMQKKYNYFNSFWHDDKWLKENKIKEAFDYSLIDYVIEFSGTHPEIMKERIKKQDWDFVFNHSKRNFTPKEWFLYMVEKYTGWRIGEYRNYRIIRK
jgi:hypothetical protein